MTPQFEMSSTFLCGGGKWDSPEHTMVGGVQKFPLWRRKLGRKFAIVAGARLLISFSSEDGIKGIFTRDQFCRKIPSN